MQGDGYRAPRAPVWFGEWKWKLLSDKVAIRANRLSMIVIIFSFGNGGRYTLNGDKKETIHNLHIQSNDIPGSLLSLM